MLASLKCFIFKLPVVLACVIFFCSALRMNGDDASRDTATLDGLELNLVMDSQSGKINPIVKSTLRNTTSAAIPFLRVGLAWRLQFRLLDSLGNVIPMEPAWERMTSVKSIRDIRPWQLAAGESLTFDVPLDQAFGARWRSGVRLEVSWEPGDDYNIQESTIKPYTIGRGLNAGIAVNLDGHPGIFKTEENQKHMPSIVPSPPVTEPGLKIPDSGPVIQKATPVIAKAEERRISWWAIGGSFVFILGAGMWLLRLTKKSRR